MHYLWIKKLFGKLGSKYYFPFFLILESIDIKLLKTVPSLLEATN